MRKLAPRALSRKDEIERILAEEDVPARVARSPARPRSLHDKERHREQKRRRGVRARVAVKKTVESGGRVRVHPFEPGSEPWTPEYVKAPDEHREMVGALRAWMAAHAEISDDGLVERRDLERVRSAVRALYAESYLPENRWKGALGWAVMEALLMEAGDTAAIERNRGRRLDVYGIDPSELPKPEPENGGTDGRTILAWLRREVSYVPETLTAERIKAALGVATLAQRGGGKSRKRHWRIVVHELIAEVTGQTRSRRRR